MRTEEIRSNSCLLMLAAMSKAAVGISGHGILFLPFFCQFSSQGWDLASELSQHWRIHLRVKLYLCIRVQSCACSSEVKPWNSLCAFYTLCLELLPEVITYTENIHKQRTELIIFAKLLYCRCIHRMVHITALQFIMDHLFDFKYI